MSKGWNSRMCLLAAIPVLAIIGAVLLAGLWGGKTWSGAGLTPLERAAISAF